MTIEHVDGVSSPEKEIAEYLLTFRFDDIENFKISKEFEIILEEFYLLRDILDSDPWSFKNIVKKAVMIAILEYRFEDNSFMMKEKARKIYESKMKISLRVLHSIKMRDLKSSEHEGKIVTFPCEIASIDDCKSVTRRALYECAKCGNIELDIGYEDMELSCMEHKRPLKEIRILKSEDIQTVILREMFLDADGYNQIIRTGKLHGEDVDTVYMGQKKKITGVFRSVKKEKKKENDIIIDIINVESSEEKKDIMPSPELLAKLKSMAIDGTLLDYLTDSFAYHIYGNRDSKFGILICLVGGNSTDVLRGVLHIALIGDPSRGKSEIIAYISRVSNKFMFTNGKGSSGIGLVFGMVKLADGRMVEMPGPVVLCHNGNVGVDEFDKMVPEDRGMLLECMAQGMVSRAIAGKIIRTPANTGIIAAANPKHGKWDNDLTILDNIGWGSYAAPLLARFNLKFRFIDNPNAIEDRRILDHRRKTRNGKAKDLLTDQEIRAYLNYVKELTPQIDEKTSKIIDDFYIDLRMSSVQNGDGGIPIDMRQYGGIETIATAIAKMLFRETVTDECVNMAIDLYKKSIESFGVSLSKGMMEGSLDDIFASKDQVFEAAVNKRKDDYGWFLEYDVIEEMRKHPLFQKYDAQKFYDEMHEKAKIIKKNGKFRIS